MPSLLQLQARQSRVDKNLYAVVVVRFKSSRIQSLTSLQQTSRIGPCMVCIDFGAVFPVERSTSQQRTYETTVRNTKIVI